MVVEYPHCVNFGSAQRVAGSKISGISVPDCGGSKYSFFFFGGYQYGRNLSSWYHHSPGSVLGDLPTRRHPHDSAYSQRYAGTRSLRQYMQLHSTEVQHLVPRYRALGTLFPSRCKRRDTRCGVALTNLAVAVRVASAQLHAGRSESGVRPMRGMSPCRRRKAREISTSVRGTVPAHIRTSVRRTVLARNQPYAHTQCKCAQCTVLPRHAVPRTHMRTRVRRTLRRCAMCVYMRVEYFGCVCVRYWSCACVRHELWLHTKLGHVSVPRVTCVRTDTCPYNTWDACA